MSQENPSNLDQVNITEETFMKRIGNFLLENTEFLQDIKMNASYSDPDLSSILKNGDFKITVGNIYFKPRN